MPFLSGRTLRAGEMNRPLQLQARQNSVDAEGRPQESWVTLARIWGKVQPLSASEWLLAQQAGLTISHQVEVRSRKELASVPQPGGPQAGHNLRLLDAGRPLNIISMLRVGEGRQVMHLFCTELQPV